MGTHHHGPRLLMAAAVTLVSAAAPAPSSGQDANEVQKLVREVAYQNEALAKSQKNVSALSDESADLLTEYRAARKRNESLRVYNAQLQELLSAQRAEHAQLEEQIERVTVVSRQVTPLMLRYTPARV